MTARVGVLAALCLVLLVAAPAGGAARGRVVVSPDRPVVGVKASIVVHTKVAAPVYAQIVSPTGVTTRVRLKRVRPGIWRAAWRFADDGQWVVRVRRAGADARVVVFQPPAALPPFNQNKVGGTRAGAASNIPGTGIVVGR